jgi:hypothetical protein
MEDQNKDLIKPLTPEGDVVNMIAGYLKTYGALNVLEISNKVYTAVQNNSMTELREVEREAISQMLQNIKTHAIWMKWGE